MDVQNQEIILENDTSTQSESLVVQDYSIHIQNIETLSITLVIGVGLLIGILIGKTFLDKLWR